MRVPLSDVELRTHAFYAWEIHGRGWKSFDYRVSLAPVFQPYIPFEARYEGTDDAKRSTTLSRLVEGILNRKSRQWVAR